MPAFAPIAIVGRACLLPGASTPDQLWTLVEQCRSAISSVPEGRWRVGGEETVLCRPDEKSTRDKSWSDRGGYVEGFEDLFDPSGFAVEPDRLRGLDPLFLWTLHCAREALRDAGDAVADASVTRPRTAAVLGNLSFPSSTMNRLSEAIWYGEENRPDALNRFTSSGPAALLEQALRLGGGAYCLDAACASSLVAIKLACDRLHDGSADRMLAGAVNRTDDLFIHIGFCALEAMSRSGQSRPFHAHADGLVPGEGAGFVVLERLADAERAGRRILGVIRGVGLSNDGRASGLLAPSASGQTRAIERAYELAGVDPGEVSLLECHATGTPKGDEIELRSSAAVFGPAFESAEGAKRLLPISSLKSNLGHLITSAGIAGLIKVLEAMKHGVLPPTRGCDQPMPMLSRGPFRLLTEAEPWRSKGTRIAGLSAFGFGGNNAHAIISEYVPGELDEGTISAASSEIAVVGLGIIVGASVGRESFEDAVATGRDLVGIEGEARTRDIPVVVDGLRFPPTDLRHSLGQQVAMLEAAREAARDAGELELGPRAAVVVGMEADAEIGRYGARWRMAERGRRLGAGDEWLASARDAAIHGLEAAGVVGTMPNIPANRINSQLDAGGFGFSVSAGQDSGLVALEIGARALRSLEVDTVIVGATDLSCERVHRWAMTEVFGSTQPAAGDAAVALVLQRLEDARRDGRHIYAVVTEGEAPESDVTRFCERGDDELSTSDPCRRLGLPFAAASLLRTAVGVVGIDRQVPFDGMPAETDPRWIEIVGSEAKGREARRVVLRSELERSSDRRKSMVAETAMTRLQLPAHLPAFELPEMQSLGRRSWTQHISDGEISMAPRTTMPLPPVLPIVTSSEEFTPAADRVRPMAVRGSVPSPDPPTSDGSPVKTPAIDAPVLESGEAVESVAHVTAARPENPPEAVDPVVAAYQNQLSLLGAAQRDFVARQTQLHLRFLEMRQRALEDLVEPPTLDPAKVAAQHAYSAKPVVDSRPAGPRAVPVAVPPSVVSPPEATVLPWPTAAVVAAPKVATLEWVEEALGQEATGGQQMPVGPSFDRQQLEVHAAGRISSIFGKLFEPQDEYERQVRMPKPPLLLADRVTGIEGEAGSMSVGTIWTETDIEWDSWYLHQGAMPAGIMIETGQADLMLISWLGVDLLNRGERVYRLLGCELTFHGDLPRPGDTLRFEIHLDGHASQGDIRLMFFHYGCVDQDGRPRLSVRGGQAGFFTDQELADSAGVLWTPEGQEIVAEPRLDPPLVEVPKNLAREALEALSEGRPWDCFGEAFTSTRAHVQTPRIQEGRMLFLEKVTDLDAEGGPWQRGYLRAETTATPRDWYFDGHFKNDPCMPGTLMFEGCLQAMAVYLSALGFTLDRDGWCFQPVSKEPFALRCRGQVTPTSRMLVYEVFVEELVGGPIPTLYADLLCTVDGLKAFHARRVGLQLVPGYPLESRQHLLPATTSAESRPNVARSSEGFEFDYRSLLACAWGRPSEAFGPIYERFDGPRKVARLPGPPYHFMTRVNRVEGKMGGMERGSLVDVDYDVPSDAWYFDQNGTRTMPYAVLLEAALQPCGWLASYIGSALTTDVDLAFRNLDGTASVLGEVFPDSGTVRTVAKLVDLSKTAAMIIVSFEVDSFVGERPVHTMKTVFGFFPATAMADQVGLETKAEQREVLTTGPNLDVDLRGREVPWFAPGRAPLAGPRLLMLDRVTGLWLDGGEHGKGRIRCEKDVDAGEWFFKAHFFSDPVQPGSLGIEAMIQALQLLMLEAGLDRGIDNPRFEPLELDQPLTWKYRGQVVTANHLISTTLDIVETGIDERGAWARADASLWVDGKRIYQATSLGMRIVTGELDPRTSSVVTLDPERDSWIRDHCPTYTVPALPMMSMVDMLAAASTGDGEIIGLRDVRVKGWLVVDRCRTLRTECDGDQVRLLAVDEKQAGIESGEVTENVIEVATARVVHGSYTDPPQSLEPLAGEREPSPYEAGTLFHGPAFQVLESLIMGESGSSSILRASSGVPIGVLNPGLLDGATHGIPHDRLDLWNDRFDGDKVAYPAWISELDIYGPTPTAGELRCEARADGYVGSPDYPAFRIQLIDPANRVWAALRLVEACFPKGPIGSAPALDRRLFLRDRQFVEGLSLSRPISGGMRLTRVEAAASDWLPGTVEAVYGTNDAKEIVWREYVASAHSIHPGQLPAALPLTHFELEVAEKGDQFEVSGDPLGFVDRSPIESFWRGWFEDRPGPVEDLYYGLIEKFVRRVVVEDPEAFAAQRGQNALYLANHQVGIESLLFSIIASGLNRVPTVTLAKIEHQRSWLGDLIDLCQRYPGVRFPDVITFFDRDDRSSLPQVIGDLAASLSETGHSVMVHVEGTRSLTCRHAVELMSGAFIDLALSANVPIVPVRFIGALPVEPLETRLSFPVGMGRMDIHFGRPLMPSSLGRGHYGERKETVIEAINSLGPSNSDERPLPADPAFEAKVEAWIDATGVSRQHATLATILATQESPSEPIRRLLAATSSSDLDSQTDEDRWLRDLASRLLKS